MVLGRLRGAMSDVAETLRRAFSDPPCHRLDPAFGELPVRGLDPFEARGESGELLGEALLQQAALGLEGRLGLESLAFQVGVGADESFTQWAAGAKVCEMPVFGTASGIRSQIPPLPKRATVKSLPVEAFRTRCQAGLEPLARPRGFPLETALPVPKVRRALELALGLPLSICGEDPQQLAKPLWMRYTLQVVKATGENIRNLDVLGIYSIPSKGVLSLRHDPRTGRLVLQLGADAVGASRVPFILARRKDDRTIVSCYLEGG